MSLNQVDDLYLNNEIFKNIAYCSVPRLKDESILYFDSKKRNELSSEVSLALPVLTEQKEKIYLFHYDKVWKIENAFRYKYLIKVILAFKKRHLNTVLSTSKIFEILDSFTISRYLSLMLSYFSNHFLVDIDWINSRFVVFFYFLTKIKRVVVDGSEDSSFISKQKYIVRNVFFIFIFSMYRLKFFFEATSHNLMLSRKYLSLKTPYKYLFSQLPRKLFLIQYSPFKVAYSHGFSFSLLKKRKYFLKRLNFIKHYFYAKRTKILFKKQKKILKQPVYFLFKNLKNKLFFFFFASRFIKKYLKG